jgi:hypothetical protein
MYLQSGKAGLKDLLVLFAMAEGQGGLNILKHADPPFNESKIYVKQIKVNQHILQAEVKVRLNAYILQGLESKPLARIILACSEWFSKNKIPSSDEFLDKLQFIRS